MPRKPDDEGFIAVGSGVLKRRITREELARSMAERQAAQTPKTKPAPHSVVPLAPPLHDPIIVALRDYLEHPLGKRDPGVKRPRKRAFGRTVQSWLHALRMTQKDASKLLPVANRGVFNNLIAGRTQWKIDVLVALGKLVKRSPQQMLAAAKHSHEHEV